MAVERYIAGLDVGTTKICVLVARLTGGQLDVISLSEAPSAGVRKGVVVDMEAASASIKNCINKAKDASDVEVKEVYVSIGGGHISCFASSGAVGIADGVVKQKDVSKVLETAQTVYVSLDKELLHIIPVEYVVDGEGEILNPLGMRGVRLEANVQIVTGSVNAVQNLVKCCQMAGVNAVDVVLDPLVSSLSCVRSDERDYGIILLDIGGGITKISLFKNNTFLGASILEIGGNLITNDLAVGLRIPVFEAERLKKAYGLMTLSDADANEEITVLSANKEERKILKSYILEIIKPRCEEMLSMIQREIKKLSGYELASCGIVLTGGISELISMDKMVETALGLPVRIGIPEGEGLIDKVRSPLYSTVVGLNLYAQKELNDSAYSEILTSDLGSMKSWFKNLFGKFLRVFV
ncbi:cell division protein FtsA [Candidatus Magnetoovum chiemensis]|nr:cell division protein FtsA [Candidatus Magnetoovum chiemensis]